MLKPNASNQSHPRTAADWATDEFAFAPLADQRHTKRLQMIATAFAQQPTASIPQACGNLAEVKAAYRFVENDAIVPAAIREPHHKASLQRASLHPVILAVQDTTTLNYSTHPCTEGLGPICHTRKSIGLLVHSTLAITPAGQPVGFLHNAVGARNPRARVSSRESPIRKVINGSRVWKPAKRWHLCVRKRCWSTSPTGKVIFMSCLSKH